MLAEANATDQVRSGGHATSISEHEVAKLVQSHVIACCTGVRADGHMAVNRYQDRQGASEKLYHLLLC